MKTILAILAIACLSSCESIKQNFGGVKVGVCVEGVCVNVEIPPVAVTESGKEVTPVQ